MVFDLQEGEFPLEDCEGETVIAGTKLVPVVVIKDGRIVVNRL